MSSTESVHRLRVGTYTPGSQIRSPVGLFRSMFGDLLASRDLAWRLALRDPGDSPYDHVPERSPGSSFGG